MSLKTLVFGADDCVGTEPIVDAKLIFGVLLTGVFFSWLIFPFDGCFMPMLFNWLRATGKL